MISKAYLTSHSRISGSRWVITPSWSSWSWSCFLFSSSVYSCYLFLISSASAGSIPFLSFTVPIFAGNVPLVFQNEMKSTEWSRAKANRVLPRERTGHSKHPLPSTQDKTLHMDITRWSIPKSFQMKHIQFSSVAQSCPTLCNPMNRSMPGLLVHHQLPEFTQTHVPESMMPSSHLILCRSLLLLPPIPPSIRVFSNKSTLRMRWPKYWSFSFSIIPSKEIPGLISFRMDWLDLLAVQGTLKSLLQHHSSKASILQLSL